MNKDTMGGRIRHLRTEQGLSQEELATRVGGTGRAQISRIETGARNADPDVIKRMAKVLGVTPSFLISGKDEPDPVKSDGVRSTFHIHGRPKGRCTVQVYPGTSDTVHILARRHGITVPELVEQIVDFALERMEI